MSVIYPILSIVQEESTVKPKNKVQEYIRELELDDIIRKCDCSPDLIVAVACGGLVPPIGRRDPISKIYDSFKVIDMQDYYIIRSNNDKIKVIKEIFNYRYYRIRVNNKFMCNKTPPDVGYVNFCNGKLLSKSSSKYIDRGMEFIYKYFIKYRISCREYKDWRFALMYKENNFGIEICRHFLIGKPKPEGGWTVFIWDGYRNQEPLNV